MCPPFRRIHLLFLHLYTRLGVPQPNMDGFCFNKGHFNHAGATETEIMPKHFGRKPYGRNNGRYYGRKAYGRTLLCIDRSHSALLLDQRTRRIRWTDCLLLSRKYGFVLYTLLE